MDASEEEEYHPKDCPCPDCYGDRVDREYEEYKDRLISEEE